MPQGNIRIASLQPSASVTLARLERLHTLCACTKYCLQVVPQLAGRPVPVLRDSWSFDRPEDLQSLLDTQPDLVIASVPYRLESLAAILKSGIPVLALAPHSLQDIYGDLRLIGRQVEAAESAERLIQQMQAALASTEVRTENEVAGVPRPSVYCEEWGKPLIHSQCWVAELVTAAGGDFVGVPGSHTTAAAIAQLDPDVLVFAWCGAGDRVPLERVIEQRGWQAMRAVRTGRVFCIPDEFLNTPAYPLLQGLACLAAALHPRLFPADPRLRSIGARKIAGP